MRAIKRSILYAILYEMFNRFSVQILKPCTTDPWTNIIYIEVEDLLHIILWSWGVYVEKESKKLKLHRHECNTFSFVWFKKAILL